jgi:hypothetical protein
MLLVVEGFRFLRIADHATTVDEVEEQVKVRFKKVNHLRSSEIRLSRVIFNEGGK